MASKELSTEEKAILSYFDELPAQSPWGLSISEIKYECILRKVPIESPIDVATATQLETIMNKEIGAWEILYPNPGFKSDLVQCNQIIPTLLDEITSNLAKVTVEKQNRLVHYMFRFYRIRDANRSGVKLIFETIARIIKVHQEVNKTLEEMAQFNTSTTRGIRSPLQNRLSMVQSLANSTQFEREGDTAQKNDPTPERTDDLGTANSIATANGSQTDSPTDTLEVPGTARSNEPSGRETDIPVEERTKQKTGTTPKKSASQENGQSQDVATDKESDELLKDYQHLFEESDDPQQTEQMKRMMTTFLRLNNAKHEVRIQQLMQSKAVETNLAPTPVVNPPTQPHRVPSTREDPNAQLPLNLIQSTSQVNYNHVPNPNQSGNHTQATTQPFESQNEQFIISQNQFLTRNPVTSAPRRQCPNFRLGNSNQSRQMGNSNQFPVQRTEPEGNWYSSQDFLMHAMAQQQQSIANLTGIVQQFAETSINQSNRTNDSQYYQKKWNSQQATVLKSIPHFYGNETHLNDALTKYLVSVEHFLRTQEINEDELLRNLIVTLRGTAHNWFLNQNFGTMRDFKREIRKRFGGNLEEFEVISILCQKRIKKNQSLTDHVEEMIAHFNTYELSLNEAAMCKLIIQTMPDPFSSQFKLAGVETEQRLMEVCHLLDGDRKIIVPHNFSNKYGTSSKFKSSYQVNEVQEVESEESDRHSAYEENNESEMEENAEVHEIRYSGLKKNSYPKNTSKTSTKKKDQLDLMEEKLQQMFNAVEELRKSMLSDKEIKCYQCGKEGMKANECDSASCIERRATKNQNKSLSTNAQQTPNQK